MEKGRESDTSPAAYPTWHIRTKKDGCGLPSFVSLAISLERMCQVASTGKNLRRGVDSQPEPLHLRMAAQPGAQFIQLDMREPEMAEEAFMQGVCVLANASEPGSDGGVSKAEDPRGRRRVEPFRQRREDHGDLLGRRFQSVQGGVVPGSERGAARLTPKGLDRFALAMFAIADQRLPVRVSVAEVRALRVRTGVAGGVHPLGRSASAFHLAPGAHRRGRSPTTRRGR
jgi:hypothetical protein